MSAAAPDPNLQACDVAPDLSAFGVPHASPFVARLTVEPGQISRVIDHVSNVEYLRWLDRAAELHSDAVGYTRRRLLDRGLMWFVARHEIDYLAEVGRGDELYVATWVRTLRRVKSWRDYLVVRPRDEVVVCRAATLWVLVRLDTRRPVRIDPEMIRRFAPLEADDHSPRQTDGLPCASP